MTPSVDYQTRPLQYLPNKDQDIEVFNYYFPDEDEVQDIKETLH